MFLSYQKRAVFLCAGSLLLFCRCFSLFSLSNLLFVHDYLPSPPFCASPFHNLIVLLFLLYLLYTGNVNATLSSTVCCLSFSSLHFLPSSDLMVLPHCCSLETLTARNSFDFSLLNVNKLTKNEGKLLREGEVYTWWMSATLMVTRLRAISFVCQFLDLHFWSTHQMNYSSVADIIQTPLSSVVLPWN